MVHLESTGVRWPGFTKSECLGVKIDKAYGLVLNTKSCLKMKIEITLPVQQGWVGHNADGEESCRSGCAVSIIHQGVSLSLSCPACLDCLRVSQDFSKFPFPTAPNLLPCAIPLFFSHCESDIAGNQGGIFRPVEITAPCQDKNLGRGQERTL